MALPLTEEQKVQKRAQDAVIKDQRNRQSFTGFPTNTQVGQEVPVLPIANQNVNNMPTEAVQQPQQIQQAQQLASQGFQSQVQPQLNQIGQQLLNQPQLDTETSKQAALSRFDQQQSQATEAFRRMTGGLAGSSDRNQELLNRLTTGAFNRAQLESQLDEDLARQKREDLLARFGVGQEMLGIERQGFQDKLSNLLQTGQAQVPFEQLSSQERTAQAQRALQDLLSSRELSQEERLFVQDLASRERLTSQQLSQEERLKLADIASRERLGQAGLDLQRFLGEQQIGVSQRELDIREFLGQEEMASRERIAEAELASRQNILLQEQEFQTIQSDFNRQHEKLLQEIGIAADEATQQRAIQAAKDNLIRDIEFREKQAELGREFTAEQSRLDRALKESLAHLDIDGQKEMINLRAALDKDQLLTQQDFQKAQSALDRALEKSLQEGNFQNAMELQTSQNEFNQLMEENRQRWVTSERTATQAWESDEKIAERDFQDAMMYFDHQNKLALQSNDIIAQENIEQMRNQLQLKLQTQDMEYGEKMLRLEDSLQKAKLADDFNRQVAIMKMQTAEEMKVLQQQNRFEESMMVLDNKLKTAFSNNDFQNAKALQQIQHQQNVELQFYDNQIKQAELALREKGLDLDQNFREWQQIQSSIDAGQMDPEVGLNYLRNYLPVELQDIIRPPDPLSLQKALQEDYLNQQLQWSLSHPDSAIYDGDTFVGLKDEALEDFNKWVNKLYTDGGGGTVDRITGIMNKDATLQEKEISEEQNKETGEGRII